MVVNEALGGDHSPDVRLKRYRLDSLATGREAGRQRERARRSLEALERLGKAEGALPLLGPPLEVDDSFVVVTAWPRGVYLGYLLESGELEADAGEELCSELVRAVASIHAAGIIHRNITPDCAHVQPDGGIVLTDFDYARLPGPATKGGTVVGSGMNPEFAAPEVLDDPSKATRASDVWSVAKVCEKLLAAAAKEATTARFADVTPGRWRKTLAAALAPDPADRPADAEILFSQLSGAAQVDPLFNGFEAYDVIDDRYVVLPEVAVAEGFSARVYHVDDTLHRQEYAAKFLKLKIEEKLDANAEFMLLRELPAHECIVKPELLQQATSVRKDRALLSVAACSCFRDGSTAPASIACWRRNDRSSREAEIALAVAKGLAHLQAHDVIHRAIKPQNIIVGEDGVPRLVDFNIGRTLVGSGDTLVGTPGYTPPDLSQCWLGKRLGPLCALRYARRDVGGKPAGRLDRPATRPPCGVAVSTDGTAATRNSSLAGAAVRGRRRPGRGLEDGAR